VQTTLDAALQIGVEGVVAREARFLGDQANVSSLVINNSDHSVLAYVGGSDYFGPAGMVCTAANRESPPRITFPPNGAHLVLAREGSSFTPLALEAMGGAPPYRGPSTASPWRLLTHRVLDVLVPEPSL
jgi:hypothetical protein